MDILTEALTGMIPDWTLEAMCANQPENYWFPQTGGNGIHDTAMGKRICNVCPVRLKCLQDALDRDEQWGTWGGLTTEERRALKAGAA